jgi:hypothetical protein
MTDHLLTAMLQDPDPMVRRRALLVRDAVSMGPTEAARRHGVTRQTAAKWVTRFQAGGAERLPGEPRRRHAVEETRQAVLTAPLWMPTTKWSSRTIASAVGVSQSSVARTWAECGAHTAVADRLAESAVGREPVPAGLLVTSGCSVLVVELGGRRAHPPVAPASPRTRRALRTVLAADLVRSRIDDDPAVARTF